MMSQRDPRRGITGRKIDFNRLTLFINRSIRHKPDASMPGEGVG